MTDTANTTGEVYIAAGARTPMGGLQGALADLTAVELGAAAIKEAVKKANLSGEDIEEIIETNLKKKTPFESAGENIQKGSD